MKRVFAVVVLILALGTVVLPAALAASDTYQTKIKGKTAESFVYESDGCMVTYGYIYASETAMTIRLSYVGPGAPDKEVNAWGYFYYLQYDYCTGQVFTGFNGYIPNPDVTIRDGLTTARVKGSTEMYNNVTGGWETGSIDATWTGVGKVSRGNGHQNYSNEYYSSRYHYNGSWRRAEATASLEFSGGTVDLSFPDGDIYSTKSGELSLTRY